MFNCYQVSYKGRVWGLFPTNAAANAFVYAGVNAGDKHDDYKIEGRFIPGLPF